MVAKRIRGGEKSWEKPWDNSLPSASKLMVQMLEEMCRNYRKEMSGQRSLPSVMSRGGSQQPTVSQGASKPVAWKKNDDRKLQTRCFRCQKPGHFMRECRANIYATDECATVEWFCEDHVPKEDMEEEGF